MADVVWSKTYSTKEYFAFKLGLKVTPTVENAKMLFDVEVWFWSQYAINDGEVNLYYRADVGIDTAHADAYLVKRPAVRCNGNSGSGWPEENKIKLYSAKHTFYRGTAVKVVQFFAHVGGIYNYSTSSGGLITANCSEIIDPLKTYTVSFDANGGARAPAELTVNEGAAAKLPTDIPSRNEHSFLGWAENSDAKDGKYAAGSTFTPKSSVTLYAVWASTVCTNTTVHFAEGFLKGEGWNGRKDAIRFLPIGEAASPTFTAQHGSKFTLSKKAAELVPNGFSLRHVNTSGLDGAYRAYDPATEVTQPASGIKLEYYYQPDEYSINYDLDGGSFSGLEPPATYNVLYGATFPVPQKDGCTFEGWYDHKGNCVTGVNETTPKDEDEKLLNDEGQFETVDKFLTFLNGRTKGNLTLTAKWKVDGAAYVKCDGEMKKGLPWVKNGSKWERGVPWCKTADGWRKGGL